MDHQIQAVRLMQEYIRSHINEDISIDTIAKEILQEKYKDIWRPICPDRGKDQLLWMIGEIGEVIDIVKKHGGEKASKDAQLREHLIEEMADILMYYNDILLCYEISEEDLKKAYINKFEKNMQRW